MSWTTTWHDLSHLDIPVWEKVLRTVIVYGGLVILLRLALKTLFGLIMLPLVLIVAFIGIAFALLAVSFAVLLPLMPFVAIGVCVWLLTRSSRAATVVRG